MIGEVLVQAGAAEQGIAILEACAAENPREPGIPDMLAQAYLTCAQRNWSRDGEGNEIPTTRAHVEEARSWLAKAETLPVADEELKARITAIRQNLEAQGKTRFDTELWRVGFGAVWLFMVGPIPLLPLVFIPFLGTIIGTISPFLLSGLFVWGHRLPQYVINRRALAPADRWEQLLTSGSKWAGNAAQHSSTAMKVVSLLILLLVLPLLAVRSAVRKWKDLRADGLDPAADLRGATQTIPGLARQR